MEGYGIMEKEGRRNGIVMDRTTVKIPSPETIEL